MKADSRFGNTWMMGVGEKFKYPPKFEGSPIGPDLDPPSIADKSTFRNYSMPGRKKRKPLLSTIL